MKNGFTFVELMITLFIMLLLLMLSFPFYTSINKKLTLDRTATRFVQDVRKAQELAMSAQENNGSIPRGGYGIYIPGTPATSYIIFADEDGDQRYDSAKDELVDNVAVEKGVQITSVQKNIRSIVFLAPDPAVTLSNAGGRDMSTAESISTFSNGTDTVKIHVNRAGLVYIE
jgi:prepilin-type N-terminal cleavage/methylation domain-containing protein